MLGHLVNANGISPNPHKITSLQQIVRPSTPKEARQFLGAVNFYRRFIPACSTLSEGLVALTRGKGKKIFEWGEAQEKSFKALLKALCEAPVLRFPDWQKRFFIETDASDVGIGAALTQENEVELRLPVAYASRTLDTTERKYSVTDREGLGVVWAVKHFVSYILGMPFTIVTDHAALKALRTKERLEGRMRRWAEFLSDFDYDIIYRKGSENVLPDLLSRALLGQDIPLQRIPISHKEEYETAIKRNRIWIRPDQRERVLRDSTRTMGRTPQTISVLGCS